VVDRGVDSGESEDFGVGGGVVRGCGEEEVGGSQRMVTMIREEGRFEGGGRARVVESEGACWEESGPVRLVVVAKHPKVGFRCLIRLFRLTVSLRVERRSKVRTNAEELDEGGEEGGGEGSSAIREDVCLKTVMSDDVVKVHFGEIRRVESIFLIRDEDDHLGEAIDEDLNAVESVGERELDDSVHRNLAPGSKWRRDRLEEAEGELSRGFVSSAGITTRDVGSDEIRVQREDEGSSKEVVRLGSSEVTSKEGVVAGANDVEAKLVIVGYSDESLEEDEVEGWVE
jgi:hypothetical protein